ncbi:MAG: DUF4194 domain-containing protein [Spirochaetaceae bacterium]|nr:DUF4194 domain-containing protein [Spirochaetaceae bacterium]
MNRDINEWAVVCIKLLQGPIIRKNEQDKTWNLLLRNRSYIDNYFATIGITLLVEESDGYAFLRQKNENIDEDFESLPRLIRKVRLSVEESFLCVILREALDYFESSDDFSEIFTMKENEIMERLKNYSPEYTDELKFQNKLKQYLNKFEDLGYVENLSKKEFDDSQNERNDIYKINKIIRAIVSPEFLEDFRNKLVEHNNMIKHENEQEENNE